MFHTIETNLAKQNVLFLKPKRLVLFERTAFLLCCIAVKLSVVSSSSV